MSVKSAYHRAVSRLRDDQVHKLSVLEWFLSESDHDRGSGRTHLLCLAYLREAMTSPNTRIQVRDHLQGVSLPGFVVQAIRATVGPGTGLEAGPDWILVKEQLLAGPRSRIGASSRAFSKERLKEALGEVRLAAEAAMRLGADLDDVVTAAREALVQSVIEE